MQSFKRIFNEERTTLPRILLLSLHRLRLIHPNENAAKQDLTAFLVAFTELLLSYFGASTSCSYPILLCLEAKTEQNVTDKQYYENRLKID